MTLQYRHGLGRLRPPFLRGPNARSFWDEGLAVLYDVDRAWMQEALFARMPDLCDETALPLLLLDRRLRRGPYTSNLAVRRYLRLWWDQWELAGLFPGLLLAVQAFLAPDYPQVRIWTRGQTCYTMAAGTVGRALSLPGYVPLPAGPDGDLALGERLRWSGLVTRSLVAPGTWDWDSVSHPSFAGRWWHFWMSIHGPPLWAPWEYDLGYQYDTPTLAWGMRYPPGELDTLDLIVRDYAPHETRCVSMIVCEDEAAFDPADPNAGNPAFGWPNGQWGAEAKDDGFGNAVPTRNLAHRYWAGVP